MNKQIKFRVWDEFLREMISGDGLTVAFTNSKLSDVSFEDSMGNHWSAMNRDLICGQRFFAQQFTGLKDLTGEEIYEGDILAFPEGVWERGSGSLDDRMEVIWDDKHAKFGINFYSIYGGEGSSGRGECLSDYSSLSEIIGNIFENPELLKQHVF